METCNAPVDAAKTFNVAQPGLLFSEIFAALPLVSNPSRPSFLQSTRQSHAFNRQKCQGTQLRVGHSCLRCPV